MNHPSVAAAVSFALRVQGDAPFLGRRRRPAAPADAADAGLYEWSSYSEVANAAAALSAGLRAAGAPRRACVAVCAENRPEWLVADLAAAFGDFLLVGIHTSWSPRKTAAVLADVDAQVMICSAVAAPGVADALAAAPGAVRTTLRHVVLMDDPDSSATAAAALQHIDARLTGGPWKASAWSSIVALGHSNPVTHTGYGFPGDEAHLDADDDPSSPYTLMFSSGTSGGAPKATATPKSMWMKSNCMGGPFALFGIWDRRAISYLSLAHGADRGVAWQALFAGATLGFARCGEEDMETLLQDMCELRPTFLLGMANFWSALHARHETRLRAALDEELTSLLCGRAADGAAAGSAAASSSSSLPSSSSSSTAASVRRLADSQPLLWDQLRAALLSTRRGGAVLQSLLNVARTELGGSLQLAATGGSLTPRAVRAFMAHLLSDGNETRVKDSYGMTEFPGISSNGEIAADVDLKLAPVVRGGVLVYDPDDPRRPRGEIWVRRKRSPGQTNAPDRISFWKRPDLDAAKWLPEAEGGWFRTGDVGELDYSTRVTPNEYHETSCVLGHPEWRAAQPLLRVIDRVKSLEEIYWRGDSKWISVGDLEARLTAYKTKGAVTEGEDDADDASLPPSSSSSSSPASSFPALAVIEHLVLVSDRNESGLVAIVMLLPSAPPPSPALRHRLLAALQGAGKADGFAPHEIPVGLVLEGNGGGRWTSQNLLENGDRGLLTVTGKPKRASIKAAYHARWMAEYAAAAAPRAAAVADSSSVHLVEQDGRAGEQPTSAKAAMDDDDNDDVAAAAAAARTLIARLEQQGQDEPGLKIEGTMRPLPIKKGHRRVDCRIRVVDGATDDGDAKDAKEVEYHALRALPAKASDETVRGRDWLADRVSDDDASVTHRRFQFAMVMSPLSAAVEQKDAPEGEKKIGDGDQWELLPAAHRLRLNQRLNSLREVAMRIRKSQSQWNAEYKRDLKLAQDRVDAAAAMFRTRVDAEVAAAERSGDIAPSVAAFLQCRFQVERSKINLERVRRNPEQDAAYKALDTQQVALRQLGDALDVNTRKLPVTWVSNVDWMIDTWRNEVSIVTCPMCQRNVLESALLDGTHTDWVTCTKVGLAPKGAAVSGGSSMGGNLAVSCNLTGILIDSEANDLHEPDADDPQARKRVDVCPVRAPRMHALCAGVDRLPWAHAAVRKLRKVSRAAPRRNGNAAWLARLDAFPNDVFCLDKQGSYWLFDFVKYGAVVPHRRTQGRPDTPASLILRACEAFSNRPCLGVPVSTGSSAPPPLMSRATPYTALADSAGITLSPNSEEDDNGNDDDNAGDLPQYRWLLYRDLGIMVQCVARGLLSLGIPRGSHVAIAGYNDLEFCVADFALAAAGMVSVGIHGTYSQDEVAHALHQSECVALLYMHDLALHAGRRRDQGLWCVGDLRAHNDGGNGGGNGGGLRGHGGGESKAAGAAAADGGTVVAACPRLTHFVVMDVPAMQAAATASDVPAPHGSFCDWIHAGCTGANPTLGAALGSAALPDPFDARGSPFRAVSSALDSGKGTAATHGVKTGDTDRDRSQDVTTMLFTSGSSGPPKAVAVSCNAFVYDITGCKPEAEAVTRGLTVSYIPLSHSSDRYKVWQHVAFGGRVGFAAFGAEQWEWREKDKESQPGASPVEMLFRQIAALRPTSMSLPPNIWAGLHGMFRDARRRLASGLVAAVATGQKQPDPQQPDQQPSAADALDKAALDQVVQVAFGIPCRVASLATGGAPTPAPDMAFARRLCRHVGASVVNSYGTTEAGALTSDGRQLAADKFWEVEVQLVDFGSAFTSKDQPFARGEIVVRSPVLALGYMGNPKKTAEAFVVVASGTAAEGRAGQDPRYAHLSPGRWYRTGDLGFFDDTGQLHLLGRASSHIDLGDGHALVAADHEGALAAAAAPGRIQHVVVVLAARSRLLCIVHVGENGSSSSSSTAMTAAEVRATAPWSALAAAAGGEDRVTLVVTADPWTVGNGLLTGSQKVARKKVERRYG